MKKVEVLVESLIEFLDQCEGGKLYPELKENDVIIRVNINPVTAEFIIGERYNPYKLTRKS